MKKGQDGEDFVNDIAYTSFLKYWCFPGPLDITGDNKEICDLLILFNETLILVSVKNYKFDRDYYERYFKKTVGKAIKQINGAERKLFGDRVVLLKHPSRNEVVFPKDSITRTYRVIVNLNSDVKYYKTSVHEKGKTFIIMDSGAWLFTLKELNTIPDFTNYLESRNRMFGKFPAYILPRSEFDFDQRDAISIMTEVDKDVVDKKISFSTILGTELDLIATYLKNGFKFPEKLNHDEGNSLYLAIDGEWLKYANSDYAKEKNEFEKEGYFIDHLIKEVLKERTASEKVARILFSLNRIERTLFAQEYLKYHHGVITHPEEVVYNRTHFIGFNHHFVFMCFQNDFPPNELEGIITMSILHHAYLHDFNVEEIAVIGVSKDFQTYMFGYGNGTNKPDTKDLNQLIERFKKLGWKIK